MKINIILWAVIWATLIWGLGGPNLGDPNYGCWVYIAPLALDIKFGPSGHWIWPLSNLGIQFGPSGHCLFLLDIEFGPLGIDLNGLSGHCV